MDDGMINIENVEGEKKKACFLKLHTCWNC